MLRASARLNHRQLALLGHALRHAEAAYTVTSHEASNGVAKQTARNDLYQLASSGLLIEKTRGKKKVFEVPSDLAVRLKKMK